MKRLVIPFLALTLSFAGFTFPSQYLYSQSVTISGSVADSVSGEALAGVAIMVPEAAIGVYSEEDGSFSLSIPTVDTIRLEIAYTGYRKVIMPLNIGGRSAITLRLTMVEEALSTDDVVITAARGFEQRQADVTVSIEVMKQHAIDLQAAPNIDKVITQIPGVDNLDGQINIRGSSGYAFGVGSRVMVMKDGLPLLSGDAGFAELSLIPVDNVSRVEVIKGASSVLYGSGSLGGVINVIANAPGDKPMTSLRLRGAIYDSPANPDLDWDGPSSAYQGSAHIFHSRRIGDLDFTIQGDFIKDSGYRLGTDKEEFRGNLLLGYRPKRTPGLSFGLNISTRLDSSSNMNYWRSYFPKDSVIIANGAEFDTSLVGGALTPPSEAGGYRHQKSSRVALDPYIKYLSPGGNLFWYRGRYLRTKNDNNTGQSYTNYISYNDFMFQRPLLENKLIWTVGATYTFTGINSEIYGGEFKTGNSIGAFTQVDGKFGRLNTNFGVRLESAKVDTLERETQPVFRAGLNYEITRGTNVRASFGQAFRVPSVAERFTATVGGGAIILPNPNLKSETGYTFELGFRQGFESKGPKGSIRGFVDIAGFLQRYNNMVEFTLDTVTFDFSNGLDFFANFTSDNVSDARITGAELTMSGIGEWGDFRSSLSGGVTFINPINLNAVSDSNQLDLSTFLEDLENASNAQEFFDILGILFDEDLSDNPRILKYRSPWVIRASGSVGYKQFDLTTNFRYRSYMQSIDQALYLVIEDLDYARSNLAPKGEPEFDFILSYKPTATSELSLNVSNAFNFEYMSFPGTLAQQRKFTMQYLIRF